MCTVSLEVLKRGKAESCEVTALNKAWLIFFWVWINLSCSCRNLLIFSWNNWPVHWFYPCLKLLWNSSSKSLLSFTQTLRYILFLHLTVLLSVSKATDLHLRYKDILNVVFYYFCFIVSIMMLITRHFGIFLMYQKMSFGISSQRIFLFTGAKFYFLLVGVATPLIKENHIDL